MCTCSAGVIQMRHDTHVAAVRASEHRNTDSTSARQCHQPLGSGFRNSINEKERIPTALKVGDCLVPAVHLCATDSIPESVTLR